MKILAASFFLLLPALVRADVRGECPMAAFYLELGCSPLQDGAVAVSGFTNNTKCPNAFKCPDLHPNPSMCYYKGVPYEDNTTIPQALITSPCSMACSCKVTGDKAQFECAAVDCYWIDDMEGQCIRIYKLNACCSIEVVCDSDAIAKLSACEMDDETYKEGQFFVPKNTLKHCICTDKWNGSIDNPEYCRDINCGIEIRYQYQLFKSCAPIFSKNNMAIGCPNGFQCPTVKVPTIKGVNKRGVKSKCRFGKVTLSVGDALEFPGERCTRCSCNVPPFLSCYETTGKCK